MDKYGCLIDCKEDWDLIRDQLVANSQVSFTYCTDGITAYIITIFECLNELGVIAWGGRIKDMYGIGIRRSGFEFFNLKDNQNTFSPSYIAEKFPHARTHQNIIVCELLNELKNRMSGVDDA